MTDLARPVGNRLAAMAGQSGTPIQFPDVPKLELDELIEQLIDRAHGVQRVQGRLRALLRAIETVAGDLLNQRRNRSLQAVTGPPVRFY